MFFVNICLHAKRPHFLKNFFEMPKKTDKNKRAFCKSFGAMLLRFRGNTSQTAIADLLNVSRTTYGKWERGDSCPDTYHLCIIKNVLAPEYKPFFDEIIAIFNYEIKPMMTAAELPEFLDYLNILKKRKRG